MVADISVWSSDISLFKGLKYRIIYIEFILCIYQTKRSKSKPKK